MEAFLISKSCIKKQPLPFSKHTGKIDFLFSSKDTAELLMGQTVRVSITQMVPSKLAKYHAFLLSIKISILFEQTWAFKSQIMGASALVLLGEA